MIRLSTLVIVFLLAAPLEATTVYRWTDAQGRVHFSDERPPAGVDSERIRMQGREVRRQAAPGNSDRVRRIRCRDFQGALVQLKEVEDVATDDARWLAAKDLARDRIEHWCNGAENQ
ncbi:hypothetical protein J2T57_003125 [Natronocella acetinitrilica]|uniref:DUF4124 domain-containing protein n=1 Tax=Natronocella acetinitrilica TaxID=414046 RepID=A0AAE3G502_9GAMM|nr:DUF4124 domain-containing protein [Natronocella acetinitrilica]MCP1675970.1 hypothetical protein [Natronocella acetinitrilica]